jgi:hypothetical protein
MKQIKNILALIATFGLAATAFGQGTSFDYFGGPRALVVQTPTNILATYTNPVSVDISRFTGIARLDIFSNTNGPGSTPSATVTIETSPDQVTWTALQNYALAVQSSIKITNTYYGTNLVSTNNFNLPGTVTTPTSSTAGWATEYLVPSAFTNTGAVTVTAQNIYSLGFVPDDQSRYMRTRWTLAAGTTNLAIGVLLTGRTHGSAGGF